MKVLTGSPESWNRPSGQTALTIGVFDGVHRGHRELLARAFENDGRPAVVTFDPHPVEVLTTGIAPRLITVLDERLALLEEVGVGLVAVLDLADVRYLEPESFVQSVLLERMNAGSLTVGIDFQFGRDRSGDVAFLEKAGAEHGFGVDAIDLVGSDGAQVSSTRIRNLIEGSHIEQANDLLGSRYRLTNRVLHGDERGREIGFPTANLRLPTRKVIPGDGVYATVATLDGQSHIAATNVGVRPTFGGGDRLVEAYLLDFNDDIYDQDLTLEFVAHLRPELKFDKVSDLIDQMAGDVEQARDIVAPVMG